MLVCVNNILVRWSRFQRFGRYRVYSFNLENVPVSMFLLIYETSKGFVLTRQNMSRRSTNWHFTTPRGTSDTLLSEGALLSGSICGYKFRKFTVYCDMLIKFRWDILSTHFNIMIRKDVTCHLLTFTNALIHCVLEPFVTGTAVWSTSVLACAVLTAPRKKPAFIYVCRDKMISLWRISYTVWHLAYY